MIFTNPKLSDYKSTTVKPVQIHCIFDGKDVLLHHNTRYVPIQQHNHQHYYYSRRTAGLLMLYGNGYTKKALADMVRQSFFIFAPARGSWQNL